MNVGGGRYGVGRANCGVYLVCEVDEAASVILMDVFPIVAARIIEVLP